jgi:hypothetical protein
VRHSLKNLLGICTLTAIGILSALVICEIGLSIANSRFPYFYAYDASRGWALRPGAAGLYRREGGSQVQINSAGFRDREHSVAKPADTVRIAVLGDSYVEAIQVPLEKTFGAVIERNLNEASSLSGKHVEVMNFGVDGYGTAQELLTLREKVWQYSPDYVVLAFFPGNDVRNNSISLEPDQCRPFFVLHEGELVSAGPFAESRPFRMWCATRFDYRAGNVLRLARNAWTVATSPRGIPTTEYPIEPAINYNVYRAPSDSVWKDAWEVTDALIAEMAAEVRDHQAQFLLVTLDGVGASPDDHVAEFFERKLGVEDVLYPERRLAALGENSGFEVLNLETPLQLYAHTHHAYLHGFHNGTIGFGHWNEVGHRVAGDLISRKLSELAARTANVNLARRTTTFSLSH